MKSIRTTRQARTRLDTRLSTIRRAADHFRAPAHGWIKAIREGLGMSTAQLARRVGVKQPTLVKLEQSEALGTIALSSLRRVAEALDCTVVYALVPNKPLEATVRSRARAYLTERLAHVDHTMLLEDQSVSRPISAGKISTPIIDDDQIEDVLRETNPRRLWDE